MTHKLIFILLTVTSFLFISCGNEAENLVPINTTINMNGFLDHFRGGKIEVKIYNDSTNECSDFLDTTKNIEEKEEKLVDFDIPEGNEDISLSQTNVKIMPGVKTIYAVLKDKNGDKRGHDCQKAIKCSSLGTEPLPDDAYNIKVGDKACVYLDIKLIP